MNTHLVTREKIIGAIEELPAQALPEIAEFISFLQFKLGQAASSGEPPYQPVRLGGLWQSAQISDEDIADVRREMWQGFGKKIGL